MNLLIHTYSKHFKPRQNAFTILELLIVIGLIIILALTLLTLLNPAEAQKRNRDAKRLRDVTTLQTIVSQFLEDGNNFGTYCTTTTPCTSLTAGNADTTPASGVDNWLGQANVSNYSQTVPVDPYNATGTCVTDTGTTGSCSITYRVAVSGREYEINVRMESPSDEKRVTGDGGNSTQWFEVFNGSNALMTN